MVLNYTGAFLGPIMATTLFCAFNIDGDWSQTPLSIWTTASLFGAIAGAPFGVLFTFCVGIAQLFVNESQGNRVLLAFIALASVAYIAAMQIFSDELLGLGMPEFTGANALGYAVHFLMCIGITVAAMIVEDYRQDALHA